MTNTDLLQSQYNLVNEGVIFLNTSQCLTKLNKSAELLFNTTSEVAVGLQLAEFLGTANNHFLQVVNNITNKQDDKKGDAEGGQIGGEPPASTLTAQ